MYCRFALKRRSGSLLVNVEIVFCEKLLLRFRIERKNSLVFAAELFPKRTRSGDVHQV
jgi:hypothetical protein